MTAQQVLGPDSVGQTCEAALARVRREQCLSLQFNDEMGKWEATTHELRGYELVLWGAGTTPQSAIAALAPLAPMKVAREPDPGVWTTEDPLSPEELAELKSEVAS